MELRLDKGVVGEHAYLRTAAKLRYHGHRPSLLEAWFSTLSPWFTFIGQAQLPDAAGEDDDAEAGPEHAPADVVDDNGLPFTLVLSRRHLPVSLRLWNYNRPNCETAGVREVAIDVGNVEQWRGEVPKVRARGVGEWKQA